MEGLRDGINGILLGAADLLAAAGGQLGGAGRWLLLVLAVALVLVAVLARREARSRREASLFHQLGGELAAADSPARLTALFFDTIFKAFDADAAAFYLALSSTGPLLLAAKRLNPSRGAEDPPPDAAPIAPVSEGAPAPARPRGWDPETRLDQVPPEPWIAHRGLTILSVPFKVGGPGLALVQIATARDADARAILKRIRFVRSLLTPLVGHLALGERMRRLEDDTVTASIVSSTSQTLLNTTLDLEDLGRLLLDLSIRMTESDAGLILLAREALAGRESSILTATGFEERDAEEIRAEFDRRGPLLPAAHVMIDAATPDADARAVVRRLGFPSIVHLWIGSLDTPLGELFLAKRLGSFRDSHVHVGRLNANRLALSLKNRAYHEAVFDEYKEMLKAMVATHESTGPHLEGHSDRVAGLAGELAHVLGRGRAEVEGIRLAGKLHDIGMIGLGGEILLKPARLTAQEYDLVKHHPSIGAALTTPIHLPIPVAPLILHHHERHDGLGYPDGLKGAEIPLGARLLALAEVFDAMLTARSYREALSFEDARQRLRGMAGTQLDPKTVEVFLQAITAERWRAIAGQG